MLSEQLKELEAEGIVERCVFAETPVRIEYRITEKGRALSTVVESIGVWAEAWIDPQSVAAGLAGKSSSPAAHALLHCAHIKSKECAMADIRDLAERLWTGNLTSGEAHPVTAQFREGDEIPAGRALLQGLASASTIDTGEALVMLDTGCHRYERIARAVRKWRRCRSPPPCSRITTSTTSWASVRSSAKRTKRWARPLVYRARGLGPNFDRYKKTRGWNGAINVRQFAFPVARFEWPEHYRYPDVAYHDRLTFRSGDLTFELNHGRGETDDATWTWVPERKILAPGDLFIWAASNAGNPQKVQRFAGEWAAALRKMTALGAETMIPGHGLPIFGAAASAKL
jgi:hypothetical protein